MSDEASRQLVVPVLVTDGLVLRKFRPGDAHLAREASWDPYIPLITTVPPLASHEQARAWVARQQKRVRSGTGYSFAIVRADDDLPVGHIGLWLHKVGPGRASIGYWVLRSHRGHGLAGRALAVVAGWGLDSLGLARLELYIEPWNEASQRVAERVGFRREGLMRSWETVGDQRNDMYMYSLLPEDPR
jgi:RimJ/RimL family protein N-acetyltransferase